MSINEIATKADVDLIIQRLNAIEEKLKPSSVPSTKVTPMFPEILTLKEVRKLLNMSENTIKAKVSSGEIIRIEIYSGNFRYPATQFQKLLNQLNK